jgi:hypothetical protein
MLVVLVIGFVSGLIYALRVYKCIEADADREWAKRHGIREIHTQYGELRLRVNPILRRWIL